MFSRIAARCIHIAMLTLAALTAGCIYAHNFLSKSHKRDDGEDASYSWFDYYQLVIAGLAAFECFLWIVQSRVYENGRPSLQEIILSIIFSLAYLFSAAWQFYHAYKDSSASGFLCSTDSQEDLVDCRLWQAGLVGSAACGVTFMFIAILWTCLFRRRHNISEGLPGNLQPEITSSHVKEGNEEAAAIAAEAERRQMLHRQKQQQDHRQMTLPSLGHTPTPTPPPPNQGYPNQGYPNRKNTQYAPVRPSHDSAQESYYNPNYHTTAAYQPSMNAYHYPHQQQQYTTSGYPNAHYGGYAYNGNTTPMTQEYGRSGTPVANGGHNHLYTEEPGSYFDASSQYYTSHEGNSGHPYASTVSVGRAATGVVAGTGVTAGTGEGSGAPPSAGAGAGAATDAVGNSASTTDIHAQAQAHREYANQLKQQQSYHENMAEALNRHAQSQREGLNSGSTAPLYPAPPHSRGSIGNVSAVGGGGGGGILSSRSGDTNYSGRQGSMAAPAPITSSGSRKNVAGEAATGTAGGTTGAEDHQHQARSPSTPGSTRHVSSPQQYHVDEYSDSAQGYADDARYRDELLEEVRRQRQEEFEGQHGSSAPQDYKVPIK